MSQMDDGPEPPLSTSNMSPVLPVDNSSSTEDAGNSSISAGASSNVVHSRMSMSDEQREIKRRFEEKQREEARRIAQAERTAKKKANVLYIYFC